MAQKRSKKQIPFAISPYIWGYLATLEKQGVPIKSAFLFGSWAKGTQHQDSDIDLAIISPAFNTWWSKARKLTKAIYSDFSIIEPHGFHPNNFDPATDPVAYEVIKHGIKII